MTTSVAQVLRSHRISSESSVLSGSTKSSTTGRSAAASSSHAAWYASEAHTHNAHDGPLSAAIWSIPRTVPHVRSAKLSVGVCPSAYPRL